MAKKASGRKAKSAPSFAGKAGHSPAQLTGWAGLVLAVLSLLVFPIIMGLLGLVLGIIAAVLGAKSGSKKDLNRGLLVIGLSIVLPFVSIVLSVLLAGALA